MIGKVFLFFVFFFSNSDDQTVKPHSQMKHEYCMESVRSWLAWQKKRTSEGCGARNECLRRERRCTWAAPVQLREDEAARASD